jgi:hypothetical protein
VQAVKFLMLGIAQIQITEHAPNRHGRFDDPWMADLAPPTHEPGQGDAWNAVGQQEVQVFLKHPFLKQLANLHRVVTQFE